MMIKTAVIITLFTILSGCGNKVSERNTVNTSKGNIAYIDVSYIPGISEDYPFNICDSTERGNVSTYVDTTISSSDILIAIDAELKHLKPVDTIYHFDGRISCTIHYRNGSVSRLCLGQLYGTIFNNQQCEDNLNINYLIKKNTGYYLFIPYDFLMMTDEIIEFPDRLDQLKKEENLYLKLDEEKDINPDSLIEIHQYRPLPFLKHDTVNH